MKKSKAILMVLCAVLLVAASVMGTLAYLTDTETVTNSFTVGNVTIALDEAPVDANGKETTGTRGQANTYKLFPGHTYDKDPTIHVDQLSSDCYLFVKVVNGIAPIEAADTTENPTTTIAAQMAANGWTSISNGIYAYGVDADNKPTIVHGGEEKVVFESFTISGTVTNDELADYSTADTANEETGYAGVQIIVTAYAIQADGFENDTAAQIWAASGFGASA